MDRQEGDELFSGGYTSALATIKILITIALKLPRRGIESGNGNLESSYLAETAVESREMVILTARASNWGRQCLRIKALEWVKFNCC